MPFPVRKTGRLRLGRVSASGATYFVTACTHARAPVLTQLPTARRLLAALGEIHDGGDAIVIAATVMTDHIHLLFTLGDRLRLGQVIAKLKALGRDHGCITWRWQEDAFEHRLRDYESVEDYGFYVFMNPYRGGLCSMQERWPWWSCPQPDQFRFMTGLNSDGTPPDEWLTEAERIESRIATRE